MVVVLQNAFLSLIPISIIFFSIILAESTTVEVNNTKVQDALLQQKDRLH